MLRKHKILKMLLVILSVIIFIVLAVILFITFFPSFGGQVSKEDKLDYEKRAENYNNGKFTYPAEWVLEGLSEDTIVSDKDTLPKENIPVVTPEFADAPDIDKLNVTWFGHSAMLVQLHGMNILIDPVFSERTSPVSFIGPKRFSDLPVEIQDLPDIDVVVISHDHYDHLDMDSIKALNQKSVRFVVPLGLENHLVRWGVSSDKITNMAWWEETEINGLTIACTPSRHFSGRRIIDSDETLWSSWVFKDEYHQIFESGDSGYGGHFEEIHKRYGDFDFVMTDCAQYNMDWHYVHMFPEESAMAAQTLGAKTAMPVHWGAYVLSSHPWDDPAERFTAAAEELGITVVTPQIGETMTLEYPEEFQERWWRTIE